VRGYRTRKESRPKADSTNGRIRSDVVVRAMRFFQELAFADRQALLVEKSRAVTESIPHI